MLRTERPRTLPERAMGASGSQGPREILLAVAPVPQTHSFATSGWPDWLIPAYRSGGHRPLVRLLEEER